MNFLLRMKSGNDFWISPPRFATGIRKKGARTIMNIVRVLLSGSTPPELNEKAIRF